MLLYCAGQAHEIGEAKYVYTPSNPPDVAAKRCASCRTAESAQRAELMPPPPRVEQLRWNEGR